MPTAPIRLAEVDAWVESGARKLRFPPRLERTFEAETRLYRSRVIRSAVIPAALIYNAFLIIDFLLLPQVFSTALTLHAVITGWILIVGAVCRRQPGWWLREAAGASIPFLISVQVLLQYSLSQDHAADQYQYLVILLVVYMNVNIRPDFRIAAIVSAAIGTLYAVVLWSAPSPFATKFIGTASMTATVYLTLMANWRMERDARYAFLRRLQDQLRRVQAEVAAGHDALTGLFNRRHLDESAARLWAEADDAVSPMAVVMIDVDHFKLFNDRYGHPAGDLCLKRVAAAISSELRDASDIAARFGGEEFIVLLPRTDLAAATRIAERIRRSIEALAIPHEGARETGRVTASLGVMAGPVSAHPMSELVAGADTALYAAKRNGRNQVWPPFVTSSATVAAMSFPRRHERGAA